MEENPVDHPGIAPDTYQKLGGKTLMIFVLERIQGSFVLLFVSIVLFFLSAQNFTAQTGIPNFPRYVAYAAWACLVLFAIFFFLSFLIAWLIYINYRFSLGENSLKVKRGVINKEEVAIPYRQIQDVDVNRDLSFRIMGLSRIVILTAGHEDTPRTAESGESEGILPALDKNIAEWLQTELLKRANVQKIIEEKEVAQ